MSSSGKEKRSRIQLRHALYTKLEAAVREEAPYISNNGSVNHDCNRRSTSTHSSSSNSRNNSSSISSNDDNKNDSSRNNKDSKDETGEGAITTATNRLEYPFPLLWFEEMTPSDLDSYHADNDRRYDVGQQARKKNTDTNSVSWAARASTFHHREYGQHERGSAVDMGKNGIGAETNARASPATSATSALAAAQLPCRDGVDVKTAGMDGTSSNSEQTSMPASTTTTAAPAPGDGEARKGFIGGILQAKSRSVECLPAAETTVNGVRVTANPSAPPEASYSVASLQEAREYAPNNFPLNERGMAEKRVTSPQAWSQTCSAVDVTCAVGGGNLETSAIIAAGAQGGRPPHHHHEGLMSQATTQGTQRSMLPFLTGLPSQVMMTQQGNVEPDSVGCWEYHEDEMEEERDAVASKCIGGSPTPPGPSTVDPLFRGDDAGKGRAEKNDRSGEVAGEGADRAVTFESPEHSGDGTCGVSTERGNKRSSTNGRRARATEFEAFTQALGQTVGNGSASHNDFDTDDQVRQQRSPPTMSDGNRRSHGAKAHLDLVMVPTEEALPRGIEGGQAGAVNLLEKHLRRVRERVPEGYTARAIELALHVLSQPKVCMRSVQHVVRRGCMGAVAGGNPQQGGDFPTHADEHHVEVVGVAGLVWEILRSGYE